MPTISLPAGSRTQLEPRPAHQQHLRSFAIHAYLGIAVTLLIITIWCFKPRRRSSAPDSPTYLRQSDDQKIKLSFGIGQLVNPEFPDGFRPKVSNPEPVLPRRSPVTDFSSPFSRAEPKARRASQYQQEMDQYDKGHTSDGSDPTSSHDVSKKAKSTSISKHQAYVWPHSPQSASMTKRSSLDQLRQTTPSPKAVSGSHGRLSPSLGSEEGGRGKARLQTQQHQMSQATRHHLSFDSTKRHGDGLHGVSYGERNRHFTKPPPLTPPTLDNTTFVFDDLPRIDGTSAPQDLGGSFLDQQNPDYIDHRLSVTTPSSSPSNAAKIPRRPSYNKSVSVGITTPSSSFSSSNATAVTSSFAYSPSSHRPSSPPFQAPPQVPHGYQFVGGHMGHRISSGSQNQDKTDAHGEIFTVTNENDDGWQRHTQVHGGDICIACNGGGFYGPNVPLEDRRH